VKGDFYSDPLVKSMLKRDPNLLLNVSAPTGSKVALMPQAVAMFAFTNFHAREVYLIPLGKGTTEVIRVPE
jgi:hypothetical protein